MSKKNSGNSRFLSLIVSILMMFTTIPLDAYAKEATDISNHWAKDTIESWMDQGLAKGYPDGSFKPGNNITRAEFIVMVNRAFNYTEASPISYSDVKVGAWYYSSVEIAVGAGYIGGYPDGTMKPENPITREEAAAVLMKMNKLTENESAANVFTDAANFSWSKGAIGSVFEASLMGGYPDGSFGNHKFIKRGETVAVLDRILKYDMGLTSLNSIAVTDKDTISDPETTLTTTNKVSGGGGGGSYLSPQAAPTTLAGVAPSTAGGSDGRITGTTADMEYKLSAGKTWIPVTGTEITGLVANRYDVRYAAKEGYKAGAIAKVKVPDYLATLANQAAPTTLAGVAPSTAGGSDGRITGTTADMEYRSSAGETWIPVTGTEITGLAVGWYDVRYAAKKGYNAGAIATVTVPDYVAPLANQSAPTTLAGLAPSTAGGSDGQITGTTVYMEYRISAGETWKPVTGTEITGLVAGVYQVRYAAKEGYNAGVEATVTVPDYVAPLANQAAPTTLSGVSPSTVGGSDGRITGTTVYMEYRLAIDETWIPVTGTEITGLVAGIYEVRYAAKEGYNAGEKATVTVSANQSQPDGLVGVAPTKFGGTDGKITGTTADMEYRLLEEGTTWIPVTGTEITGLATGWYDVRYVAKEGYNPGTETQVIVPEGLKEDQSAPSGLVGVAPTKFAGTDGKITGTTADMEYRLLEAGTTWIPVTGIEITGLVTGWYDVRYAAKEGYNPGAEMQVVVPEGLKEEQSAPAGLVGVAPTAVGGTDGKITGTTADMEYRLLEEGTLWILVTGTEITGLSSGWYDVRYAAKVGYNAGPAVTVQIQVPKGTDATLNALAIDGNLLKGFEAGVLVYTIELPAVTTTVPTVTATATDSNAPVVISPASSLPGNTTILVTAHDGINTQTYTINFILTNAVPLGLKGVAPSTLGGTDGRITGTTTDMEYRLLEEGTTWIPVTGTEISGLSAGTYNVRYVTKDGYSVGFPASVVVPNPGSGKLIFTFDDGWKDTLSVAYPILNTAGFKGTVYVNRDVTQAAEYGWSDFHINNVLNYDDLHFLYDNGWDVSNHSTNHLDYKRNADGLLVDVNDIPLEWQTPEAYGAAHPEISEERWYEAWLSTLVAIGSDSSSVDRLREVYRDNQDWIAGSGPDRLGKIINGVWTPGQNLNMPLSAYHIAYPSGLYSDALVDMVKGIGALTGRATIESSTGNNIMNPVTDFFRLPVQYVETELDVNGKDQNLAEVLTSIDYAVANGSTIIIMLHRVGPVGDLYETPESLQSIVNYAKSATDTGKLDVMTISQWYNTMK